MTCEKEWHFKRLGHPKEELGSPQGKGLEFNKFLHQSQPLF